MGKLQANERHYLKKQVQGGQGLRKSLPKAAVHMLRHSQAHSLTHKQADTGKVHVLPLERVLVRIRSLPSVYPPPPCERLWSSLDAQEQLEYQSLSNPELVYLSAAC